MFPVCKSVGQDHLVNVCFASYGSLYELLEIFSEVPAEVGGEHPGLSCRKGFVVVEAPGGVRCG